MYYITQVSTHIPSVHSIAIVIVLYVDSYAACNVYVRMYIHICIPTYYIGVRMIRLRLILLIILMVGLQYLKAPPQVHNRHAAGFLLDFLRLARDGWNSCVYGVGHVDL